MIKLSPFLISVFKQSILNIKRGIKRFIASKEFKKYTQKRAKEKGSAQSFESLPPLASGPMPPEIEPMDCLP